jgi:hypothetical protein
MPIIYILKDCFPRDEETGKGWGWNLPKMHILPTCRKAW